MTAKFSRALDFIRNAMRYARYASDRTKQMVRAALARLYTLVVLARVSA